MECLTELSKEAISKLGESALQSTLKQFEYVIHHKKIIANLKEEHNKLEGVKEALQAWVDTKRINREGFDPNIQQWLYDVTAFENVLQSFEEEVVKKNDKCFGGKCPNLTNSYSLGKRAAKGIEYITKLKEEKKEFQLISYHKAPSTLGSTFTEDIKSLESRRTIIKVVIEKLKDDKFKRVSICGMGGVGKTTLVKELIKVVENKLFDKVVMAVVSQNPDYKSIQSQIADCLGLSLKSESVEGRGRELIQKLKEIDDGDDDGKTKVLVVLDDVWSGLNFDWVGLPSRENKKCSKILFTSRHEKECQKMGSQMSFHVSVLLEDEAWYLFQEITGDVVYEPDIYPIAKQISRECGGLPLAIVIVGKALENEEKLTAWEVAFEQLKNSQSSTFSDVHKLVYSRIELSFNFLGNVEHKKFLMLCGLFPEDFDIPIESLLRHAMGLGLFKVVGETWKARNRVHSLVDDLKRCCLLLDSNVPGCVKMHDIVRDAVILVAYKTEHKFMVKYDMKSLKEEKLNDINAISLILDETICLEDNLELPSLQLLQVQSNEEELPEHFFRGMKSLKVLSVKKLYIPKIPSLFEASTTLHTLQVESCNVGDISIIGKELIHLEVLSFAHSNIKELPVEIGNLSVLRLLDLTNCNNLDVISANVLIRLSRLEELYLRMDNFPWKKNDVAINELKKISHHLKVFEMKVRGSKILIKDLEFYNLQKFWIYVAHNTTFQRSAYLESNLLQVSAIDYQSVNSILMISQLIKKCEILAIRNVKDLKNIMSQLLRDCPSPYLKDLRIDSCLDLECLIDCTGYNDGLPHIQSLSLKNLQNFKEMCYTSNHPQVNGLMIEFSCLVKLELDDLPIFIGFEKAINLKKLNQVEEGVLSTVPHSESEGYTSLSMNNELFSSHLMQQFPKLEEILLQNCSSINVVFDTQRSSHFDGKIFPQLKEIKIVHLNQLTCVWSKAMHGIQGFRNLKTLTISNCDSLRHVFTPAITRAIANLEKLEINSCQVMNCLVTNGEDDQEGSHNNKEKDNVISFEKLDSLTLSNLPSIARVCANSYEVQFPSLRKLKIHNCPKLDMLFLLSAYKKHNNHSVASYSNLNGIGVGHFEENNSRSSNFHFGCTPSCSKLIRQSNTNCKINKAPSISESKPKIELNGAPLLEELCLSNFDLHDKMFLQGMDHMRIRGKPVIDGHLFSNLKSLKIQFCCKISVLLSFSSVSSLGHLEKLHISHCANINEIVSQEELEASGENIMFPALQELLLVGLLNLKAFFHGSNNLDFPSLQKVDIKFCPNMEVFSRGICSTPRLEDVNIGYIVSFNRQKKDINAAVIQGFKAFVARERSEILNWMELCDICGYFGKERRVYIIGYHRLSMLVPFSEMKIFQHVRELNVINCNALAEVFESIGEITQKKDATTHFQLQYMELVHLPRLSQIWNHNITKVVSFQNLTRIRVRECNNLKSLLSHSMARSLVQIQSIDVESCEMMEEIITKGEEYIGGNKVKTLFPKLEELRLSILPKLECVCSGDYDYDIPLCTVEEEEEFKKSDKVHVLFPNLKELSFTKVPKLKCFSSGVYNYNIKLLSTEQCPDMRTFPYGNVIVHTPSLHILKWDHIYIHTLGDLNLTIYYCHNSEKYTVELQKLETFRDVDEELLGYIKRVTQLVIINCHKLLSCIPSNMMHLFSHLNILAVGECDCIKEIFESNDSILQCNLISLTLISLPKLEHIWKNHGQILGFKCLQTIVIKQCNNLENVLPDVSMVTSIPNLVSIYVCECEKIKEIIGNYCVQQEAKIKFPNLREIYLEKLPSLKCFSQNSIPCYVEMPQCKRITIENCTKMKTFWHDGNLYAPNLVDIYVDKTKFGKDEDVNEVIVRHCK